jgi:hypothetical protein
MSRWLLSSPKPKVLVPTEEKEFPHNLVLLLLVRESPFCDVSFRADPTLTKGGSEAAGTVRGTEKV